MNYIDVFHDSHDGLRLYARDYPGPTSDAPAVICLPGLTRNGKNLASLAEHLRQRYRVICPDQRGRGRSARDPDSGNYRADVYVNDMWRLADLLQLESFCIVGSSLDGLIAIMMAAPSPDGSRGSCSTTSRRKWIPGVSRGSRARLASPRPRTPGRAPRSRPRRPMVSPLRTTRKLTGWRWRTISTSRRNDSGAGYDLLIARGVANGSAVPALWPLFNAIGEVPVLAIRGELSDILSKATFARMSRHFANLTAVEIPVDMRSGPLPAREHPFDQGHRT